MQTAIATVCLSGTLTEKVEAIANAQFKGIELFENDLLSFNGTPADATSRARRPLRDARAQGRARASLQGRIYGGPARDSLRGTSPALASSVREECLAMRDREPCAAR